MLNKIMYHNQISTLNNLIYETITKINNDAKEIPYLSFFTFLRNWLKLTIQVNGPSWP